MWWLAVKVRMMSRCVVLSTESACSSLKENKVSQIIFYTNREKKLLIIS